MNVRQLSYFICVARHQHIGKAAAELRLSQSPLSRQIIALEEELGVALFDRVKKHIILNEMGKKFLREAEDLIKSFESIKNFRSRQTKEPLNINVGYVDAVMFGTTFHHVYKIYKEKYDVSITLFSMHSKEQLSALRNNIIDIALTYRQPTLGRDLESSPLECDGLSLVLSPIHPLAHKTLLTAADLENAQWIAQPRYHNLKARESFVNVCQRSGFTPHITAEANGPLALLSLVEKGYGTGLVQSRIQENTHFNVVYRKIPWLDINIETTMLWRKDEREEHIHRFVSLLSDHSGFSSSKQYSHF